MGRAYDVKKLVRDAWIKIIMDGMVMENVWLMVGQSRRYIASQFKV